jgi:hypothetical protein
MVSRPGKYQPRFTAGELDEAFLGNTDVGEYYKGAALMRNVRPFPQGGFGLMWGTKKLTRARPAAGGGVSPVSLRPFTRSRSSAYDVAFTDGWIDIIDANGVAASLVSPFTGAQAREMGHSQRLDTMLMCHNDVQPRRLKGDGVNPWVIENIPFRNTPNYDYGATYTNGKPSVWIFNFFNVAGGYHYILRINGQDSIAKKITGTGEVANIEDILDNMPGLNPGWTVHFTPLASPPVTTPSGVSVPEGFYAIEFTGENNEGDGWAVEGAILDKADGAINSAHVQQGEVGGEAIMSLSRGWPATVLLYGQRTIVAGFKSAPNEFLASATPDLFNLDTRLKSASAPLLVPIDTEGADALLHLHQSKRLLFFTDGGEYWMADTSLDKTNPPTIVLATTHGASRTCRPAEYGGATYFVPASGDGLRELRYSFDQENYVAPNIAVRASGLVSGLVDFSLRKPAAATDTAQMWCVRADGIAAVGHVLPEEEIRAFTRRETAGAIRAVNVNGRREVTMAVERSVGNAPVLFLEREADGFLLDCAQSFTLGAPSPTLGGLNDFAGREVWVIGDNVPMGPFAVPAAAPYAIALPAAVSAGYVGLWTPPHVLTMPQPRTIGPNTVVKRPARVHTVRLLLQNTTSVAIGANGGLAFDVPLTKYGARADVPLLTAPFTGEIALEGLQGFSDPGQVVITQKFPGLLTVRAVTVEVDL